MMPDALLHSSPATASSGVVDDAWQFGLGVSCAVICSLVIGSVVFICIAVMVRRTSQVKAAASSSAAPANTFSSFFSVLRPPGNGGGNGGGGGGGGGSTPRSFIIAAGHDTLCSGLAQRLLRADASERGQRWRLLDSSIDGCPTPVLSSPSVENEGFGGSGCGDNDDPKHQDEEEHLSRYGDYGEHVVAWAVQSDSVLLFILGRPTDVSAQVNDVICYLKSQAAGVAGRRQLAAAAAASASDGTAIRSTATHSQRGRDSVTGGPGNNSLENSASSNNNNSGNNNLENSASSNNNSGNNSNSSNNNINNGNNNGNNNGSSSSSQTLQTPLCAPHDDDAGWRYSSLKCAVFGVGDTASCRHDFGRLAMSVDLSLRQLGVVRVLPMRLYDSATAPVSVEEEFRQWIDSLVPGVLPRQSETMTATTTTAMTTTTTAADEEAVRQRSSHASVSLTGGS